MHSKVIRDDASTILWANVAIYPIKTYSFFVVIVNILSEYSLLTQGAKSQNI